MNPRARNLLIPFLMLTIISPAFAGQDSHSLDSSAVSSQGDESGYFSARDSSLAADSLYQVARDLAFVEKNNSAAIEVCNRAIELQPSHNDLRILTGRLYAWEGYYDEAEVHLLEVLDNQADYEDARSALTDVYLWGKKFERAIEVIDTGIKNDPKRKELYYKKAICLVELGKTESAREALNKSLELDANYSAAIDLLESLPEPEAIRKISVAYSYNRLADTKTEWQMLVGEESLDPWKLLTIEGEQQMGFGPLIGRLSLANRFNQSGTQFEVEAYPNIRPGTYSYLALGYSQAALFPVFRLGAEIFQALPRASEVSLGFRFLHLESADIKVFTASAGKYLGNYWFNLRTFITPQDVSFSKAWNLQSRLYLKDAETYLDLSLGLGESIGSGLGAEEINYLGSRHIALQYQRKLSESNLVRVGVNLGNVEVREDAFRGDTGLFMNYSYRF